MCFLVVIIFGLIWSDVMKIHYSWSILISCVVMCNCRWKLDKGRQSASFIALFALPNTLSQGEEVLNFYHNNNNNNNNNNIFN